MYRITNWNHYNNSLIRRGDITFWINEKTEEKWLSKSYSGFGRPQLFSDVAIIISLTLRELFQLPLRSTQELLISLKKLLSIDIEVPHYTTMCRRQKTLQIKIPRIKSKSSSLNIAIDSTGLKVFGDGEWKVKQHGVSKRRTWRKLHLAVDLSNNSILFAELTDGKTHDVSPIKKLLPEKADQILADGIYDTFTVYNEILNTQAEAIVPPRKTASIGVKKTLAHQTRNNVVKAVNRLGLPLWKKLSGYHKRSLVETMMFRLKKFFGSNLKNKNFKNQQVESYLRCSLINHFTELGMPISIKI